MLRRTITLVLATMFCISLFVSCGDEKEIDNSIDAPSEEEIEEKTDEKKETNTFLQAPQPPADYQPTYKIAVADLSDGIEIPGLKVEYDLYKRTLGKYQPIPSAEVSFNGKTVQANYGGGDPSYMGMNYYPLYGYGSKDAGASLKIDPFGTVAGAEWKVENPAEEAMLTEDEYIKIARDFLATVVYDIDQFEVTSSGEFESGWKPDGDFVRFRRYVDGMKTTEHVKIEMTYDGQLSDYFSYMLNQIPKDTENPCDMDEVKAKVEAYIAEKTASRKEKYDEVNCTYDYQLTMLADGNLAILCEVDVDCIKHYTDDYYESTGSLIELVIQ